MHSTDRRMAEILRGKLDAAFRPDHLEVIDESEQPPRPRRLARGRRDAFPRGDARARASTASAGSSAAAPCTRCCATELAGGVHALALDLAGTA